MILQRLAKVAFILAVAVLSIRWGYIDDVFLPKPFELLFGVSAFLLLLYFLLHWDELRLFFRRGDKSLLVGAGLIFLGAIIGLVYTRFFLGLKIEEPMVLDGLRLLVALLSALIAYYFARSDKRFVAYANIALMLPVAFAFFLFFNPWRLTGWGVMVSYRLLGFTNNPSVFSKIIMLAFILVACHFLFLKTRRRKILAAVCLTLLWAMLVWTGSRQGFLAVGVGLALIFGIIISRRIFSYRQVGIFILALAFAFLVGPQLIPDIAREATLSRVTLSPITLDSNNIVYPSVDLRIETIWPFFVLRVLSLPFGEGPAYYLHDYVLAGVNYDIAGAHNSVLEAGMVGGWLAMAAFLLVVWKGWRLGTRAFLQHPTGYRLGLLIGLVAFFVATLFDDSLKLYWLWILLGLIYGLSEHEDRFSASVKRL